MFWKLCPVKSSRFLFFSHHFQWKIARATLVYLTNFREDLKGGKFQIVKMTWKNAQNFIICRDKNATDQWVLIFTGRDGPDGLWWKRQNPVWHGTGRNTAHLYCPVPNPVSQPSDHFSLPAMRHIDFSCPPYFQVFNWPAGSSSWLLGFLQVF